MGRQSRRPGGKKPVHKSGQKPQAPLDDKMAGAPENRHSVRELAAQGVHDSGTQRSEIPGLDITPDNLRRSGAEARIAVPSRVDPQDIGRAVPVQSRATRFTPSVARAEALDAETAALLR